MGPLNFKSGMFIMSVDRSCECGAVIPAYVLGCQACGRKYRVRDEFLVGQEILPEPPVGMWARDIELSKNKRRKFGKFKIKNKDNREKRVFEAEMVDHLDPNPNKHSYNIFVGFFLIVILLLVPYFRTQLISDSRILPYSILGLTTLVTIQAIRVPSFYKNLLLVPFLVFRHREIYRLVTSGFAHINGTHLLLNGIAIFSFGPSLMQFFIDVYGNSAPMYFVVFYFLSVGIADFPDLIRHRNNLEYSSVGASGATSAIVAAAAVADPGMQVTIAFATSTGEAPSIPGIVYAAGFLLISLYLSLKGRSGVAHLAHATGIIFGFVAMALVSTHLHLNLYGNLIQGIQAGDLTSATSTYTLNDSMLVQLNYRGSDIWSESTLDTWEEHGAKKIFSSQDCSIIIFESKDLAETMFKDWENIGPPDYYAWNVDDIIVLGLSAESSCVKTASNVLGITFASK